MAEPSQDIYTQGEYCLCYHGPMIYDARIIEKRDFTESDKIPGKGGPGTYYKVHYKGWGNKWDEFVGTDRLLKKNERNLAEMKRLEEEDKMKNGRVGGMSKRPRESSSVNRSTKRAREDDTLSLNIQMQLSIPQSLKLMLVEDWDRVVKQEELVSLPRSPTVDKILKDFEEYVKDTKPSQLKEPELLTHTVVTGLRVYFDRTLGTQLLYIQERAQFSEVRKAYITGQAVKIGEEPEMSEVYGAEHLLRMLVALPSMIALTELDYASIELVQEYVDEFLRWLEREKSSLFLSDYKKAGSDFNVTKG